MKKVRKPIKKLLSAILAFVMIFTCFTVPEISYAGEVLEAKEGDIVIIHTNDSHGRVDTNMGFSAVAALKSYYENLGAEVLLADAGDTLHGLPIATVEQGTGIVDIMNETGYDVMTPGNHDFNYGYEQLAVLRESMYFELLAANVVYEESGERLFNGYTIIERNGQTFGIFGLVTDETAYKTNPNNIEGIAFTNPVEAAKEMVEYLKEREVDHIIAVTHLGTDKSSTYTSELVAKSVDGIELIIDGHSHTEYDNGYKVNNTLIVSTGEYINNIGVVVISGDKITAGLVNAESFSGKDENISNLITEISARQEAVLSEIVAFTDIDLNGERTANRTGETNLGNLTTDAMKYVTGADIAITNGGGIRAGIAAGEISKKDLITVFPFGNYVVTLSITGEQLLEALENGVKAYPESLGGFPQVSGINFTIDVSESQGNRVKDVTINGQALVKSKTYTIAVNDFLAAGGDEYTVFTECELLNEYETLEETVAEYLSSEAYETVSVEGRIKTINEQTQTADTDKETTSDAGSESITEYVVVKGDYLRLISKRIYGDEALWKKIYEANKSLIANPDLIYIGMKLAIPE